MKTFFNLVVPVLGVLCATICLESASKGALTPISHAPDAANEPSLIGINPFPGNLTPSVLEHLYGENNVRRIDDSIDHAFRHTGDTVNVKAVARFNNPSIEERFRYFNLGNSSSRSVTSFQRVPPNFLFPVGYNLPMAQNDPIRLADSGPIFAVGVSSRTWSYPAKNDLGQDQMVTFEIIGAEGHPSNQIGNFVVAWDYFANDDRDFQDVVFEISGAVPVPVPEPASALIALIALGLAAAYLRLS